VSTFIVSHTDDTISQLSFLVSFTHHAQNGIFDFAFISESYLLGAKLTALSVIVISINFSELSSFTVKVVISASLVIV
jgi:hypothetical protein